LRAIATDRDPGEVWGLDPDERRDSGMDLPACLRPIGVSTVSTWWPTNRTIWQEEMPRRDGLDADGTWCVSPARQPRRMPAHDVEAISRVARSHQEDASVLQLERVAVLVGMQLHDAGVELGGKGGTQGIGVAMATTTLSASPAGRPTSPRTSPRSSRAGPPGRRSEPATRSGPRKPRGSRPPRPWSERNGPGRERHPASPLKRAELNKRSEAERLRQARTMSAHALAPQAVPDRDLLAWLPEIQPADLPGRYTARRKSWGIGGPCRVGHTGRLRGSDRAAVTAARERL
jgi:hypothetical protein